MDTDKLADRSDTQERWLSYPKSRLTLNPYGAADKIDYSGTGESQIEKTGGKDLPLGVAFWAKLKYENLGADVSMGKVLQTYQWDADKSGTKALVEANEVAYEWRPEAVQMTGSYSSGSLTTSDAFHDENSFSRKVVSDGVGEIAIAGSPTQEGVVGAWGSESNLGKPTWEIKEIDDGYDGFQGSVVVVTQSKAVYAIAFPSGVKPEKLGEQWVARYAKAKEATVGVGFAIRPVEGDESAQSATYRAIDALWTASTERQTKKAWWEAWLSKVPAPKSFAITDVETAGITAERMYSLYYRAWAEIYMDVMPATPDNGNQHLSLASGKPARWIKNGMREFTPWAAAWDSVVPITYLAQVEPEIAWDIVEGIVVQMHPGNDNGGGLYQNLPSRRAEAVWGTYSATGDKAKLEAVYPTLAAHLRWSESRLCWQSPGNQNCNDDVKYDIDFIPSLIRDYGYAIKMAQELGKVGDVLGFQERQHELTQILEDNFFPNENTICADGEDGACAPIIQKVFEQDGNTTYRNGEIDYVVTAFAATDLKPQSMEKVIDRFLNGKEFNGGSQYDPSKMFAGLGYWNVKPPEWSLRVYGLLDLQSENLVTTKVSDVRQWAKVLVNSFLRDVALANQFVEGYVVKGRDASAGEIGEIPVWHGVGPGNPWSAATVIDFMLLKNGVRLAEGVPTFVRLPGTSDAGVTNLVHFGQSYDMAIEGASVVVHSASGDSTIPCADGQSVTLKDAKTPEQPNDQPGDQPGDKPADQPGGDKTTDNGSSAIGNDLNVPAQQAPAAKNTVKKVTLGTITISKGSKITLAALVSYTGSKSNTKVTWKSSKPKVASVNKKGVVTAKKKGSATITATSKKKMANGKKAVLKIKIKVK
ncbi:MAG: Ig-like domain-containing protein [Propionibacteriaceae bacterium]|nr:Ig-like domain-containing protein [Propionibacteriaceae bacterium]